MEFKRITPEDYGVFEKFLNNNTQNSCENAFANLLIWREVYNNMYAVEKGQLIIKSGEGDYESFCLPLGDNFELGMELIKEYCSGKSLRIYAQEGERFDMFLSSYADEYVIEEHRDAFDYLYLVEDLCNLSGKKYHSKRNHISAFSKKYDWRYERITQDNIPKIKECAEKWYVENEFRKNKYLYAERKGLEFLLSNLNTFRIKGGAIFVGEDAVAFTLGSQINENVFDIHIEKALSDYAEAYTVINNQFIKNEIANYKYVNREDDMGLEGLRKAKLSYKPYRLIKKYFCSLNADVKSCKAIYTQAFGQENNEFMLSLFGNCFKYCKTLKENGKISSMLFLLPATLKIGEQEIEAEYLYAAATDKDERGKGYMSKLIENIKGEKPIFLKPANDSLIPFYERYGFRCITATKDRNNELCLVPIKEFSALSDKTEYTNQEYTLMYYSKQNLNINGISFPFTME